MADAVAQPPTIGIVGDDGNVVHATPKLVNTLTEVKRTMLPSEWEYMREVRKAVQRGAFAGFLVGSAVSMAISRTIFRHVHSVFRIPLGMAATSLFTVTGGMTVIPHMVRNGLFTLPDDSQIKMAMLHVIQLNNPSLNPQQMWSLIRKQKSFQITDFIVSDLPEALSFLPVPAVFQHFRPVYDDPATVYAKNILSGAGLRVYKSNEQTPTLSLKDINFDQLIADCPSPHHQSVLTSLAHQLDEDNAFRRQLASESESLDIRGLDPVALYHKSEQLKLENAEIKDQ